MPKQRMERFRAAVEADAYGTISTLGHQFEPSGVSWGFEAFLGVGRDLELAAETLDLEGVTRPADLLALSVFDASAVQPSCNEVVFPRQDTHPHLTAWKKRCKTAGIRVITMRKGAGKDRAQKDGTTRCW
jgi:hypothetical protein